METVAIRSVLLTATQPPWRRTAARSRDAASHGATEARRSTISATDTRAPGRSLRGHPPHLRVHRVQTISIG